MANRCKATEGAQQCLRQRHNKALKHTWGKRGETKEWNGDGTPKTAETPEVMANFPAPRLRDAAWFDPSPDAPTVTIPTINPNQPRPAVLSGADLLLAEVDQAMDEHERQMGDRYLLELGLAELDYQMDQFRQDAARLVDEIYQRMRFLDFAEAARVAGHHPAVAYCYAADRFDPAVMA